MFGWKDIMAIHPCILPSFVSTTNASHQGICVSVSVCVREGLSENSCGNYLKYKAIDVGHRL